MSRAEKPLHPIRGYRPFDLADRHYAEKGYNTKPGETVIYTTWTRKKPSGDIKRHTFREPMQIRPQAKDAQKFGSESRSRRPERRAIYNDPSTYIGRLPPETKDQLAGYAGYVIGGRGEFYGDASVEPAWDSTFGLDERPEGWKAKSQLKKVLIPRKELEPLRRPRKSRAPNRLEYGLGELRTSTPKMRMLSKRRGGTGKVEKAGKIRLEKPFHFN